MTVHIQAPMSDADPLQDSALLSNASQQAAVDQRQDRPRQLSPQSWVVRLAMGDVVLLVFLGLVPTWVGHQLYPKLIAQWSWDTQMTAIAVAVGLFFVSAHVVRLYRSGRIFEARYGVRKLMTVVFLTFGILMALGAATKTTEVYSRIWFFSWLLTCLVTMPALRFVVLRVVRRALRSGAFVHRALSIGVTTTPLAPAAINKQTRGLVWADKPLTLNCVGELRLVGNYITTHATDKVYITVPWAMAPAAAATVQQLKNFSADVYIVPVAPQLASHVIGAGNFAKHVSLQVVDRSLSEWNYWLKRMQDLTIAAVGLLIVLPVLIAISIAIKLDSPGPVLFRQQRMGFNGRIFELWKFRSMYVEQSDLHAAQQTKRNDPRLTRLGSFLRRTSLDELPQLINVLQGSMSVVGPRPHALQTTAEGKLLAEAIDDYAARHRVKPGITGWAQIHGLRGELRSIEQLTQRVQYDRDYIRRWSMLLDMRIILMTLRSLISDQNAY